jgi:tRNA(Ile)-lysidine synthetase-like protein
MPRRQRERDPHQQWLAGLHPALRMLAEWAGWTQISGGTLVVACSGGRDSVALAHAAWTLLRSEQGINFAQYLSQSLQSRTVGIQLLDGTAMPAMPTEAEHLARYQAFLSGVETPPSYELPALLLWHHDHGLREDSLLDAQAVQGLGTSLGVEVLVSQGNLLEQRAQGQRGNVMALARESRKQGLLAALQERGTAVTNLRCLVAHHFQDQAETVLFNLCRGSGARGLTGMGIDDWAQMLTGRPWLRLDPEQIQIYCGEHGLAWRDDPTNASLERSRAVIRHQVLPVLTAINPKAVEHIAQASFDLQELRSASRELLVHAWQGGMEPPLLDTYVQGRLPTFAFPRYRLVELPPVPPASMAVWMAIEELVTKWCGKLSRVEITQLRDWLASPRGGFRLRRVNFSVRHKMLALDIPHSRPPKKLPAAQEQQRLASQPFPWPTDSVANGLLEVGSLYGSDLELAKAQLSQCYRIRRWWKHVEHCLAIVQADQKLSEICDPVLKRQAVLDFPAQPLAACLLPLTVAQPLQLRRWRQGDRVRLASGQHKKVSDIFIDAKVPEGFREEWVLLCDANDEIVWLPALADSWAMREAVQAEGCLQVAYREHHYRAEFVERLRRDYLGQAAP